MPQPSSLRIISGTYKGTKLLSPADASMHPMGAREKLALFNMLSVEGLRVLDLYAGSGALGLEALSRGAKSVVFVEKSSQNAQIIRQNLQKLALSAPKAQVLRQSVAEFCSERPVAGDFDVVIADPPYDRLLAAKGQKSASYDVVYADLTQGLTFLAQNGLFALSSPSALPVIEFASFTTISTHTYAAARLTVYTRAD